MDLLRRIADQFDGLCWSKLTEAEMKIFEILCEAGLVVYDDSDEGWQEIYSWSRGEQFNQLQEKVARIMKEVR